MRRSVALLCALALLAAIPASVLAGKPFRETDHAISVSCDEVTDTSGAWFAYISFGLSDLYGATGYIDAWHESDDDGIPDIGRDPEAAMSVEWDGSTLSGSMPVVDQTGAALGDAVFSAALSPIDEPFSFDETFRDGNTRERYRGVSQAFQPTGTFTLPGGVTFDLAQCFADETTVTAFLTEPNAFVRSFSQRFSECDLADGTGNSAFVFVDIGDDFTYIDVGYASADGTTFLAATDFIEGPVDGGSIDRTLEVYDPETGEPTGATAELDMTLTATGDTFTNLLEAATFKRVQRGELLDIEGTLEIGGATFDLGSCIGFDSRVKEIETRPQGPKAGGKIPANDDPTAATLLRVGSRTSVQTRGAAPDAEEPFECLSFTDPDTGEVEETPVGHTVWYSFVGTGAPMTIDTAGSDFDTVVAIYTVVGGAYVPVPDGCVDDTPTEPIGRTLQASVTIPTVAGTTYLVQIGGFPDVQSYGNLRVALR
jgi:hypothetical protein